jgi:catalase
MFLSSTKLPNRLSRGSFNHHQPSYTSHLIRRSTQPNFKLLRANKSTMETIKQVAASAAQALTADPKAKDLSHNTVDDSAKGNNLTTNFGLKVSNTDDTLRAGERGPALLEDFHFREKMTHFDHERIPERVVHARGSAAHGYFQLEKSLEKFTTAKFLTDTTQKTPVFVRFSTVLGSRGSADTVRDVRGFATKFYTTEGNFDLVGNNIPVFFIQDAIKFPDLVHAGKPEPADEIPQAQTAHTNFWDFISLTPESAHMVMWALSDRAIPRSYRMMQGFGVHTFVLVNAEGRRTFVKFHWTPVLGTHSLVWDESLKLAGVDPDYHRRDLYEAIASGSYPEWQLGVQLVDEADENKFDFDLLDATKIIPEELVPVQPVGRMVLNRAPDNFFAEVEQVAFHTGHLVPGVEASEDPLLQGRMFSYVDTQLTRLGGPNFEEIPINRPICPVFNNQRDGFHRMTINKSPVNYYPNRFGCPFPASRAQGGYAHAPTMVHGKKVRAKGPKFAEHYSQARMFYQSLSDWEREHLINAGRFELGKVTDQTVRERVVDLLSHIDLDMAKQIAIGVGVKPPTEFKGPATSQRSPAVSQANAPRNSITSRRIAVLIGPGYSSAQYAAVSAAFSAAGAMALLVGPVKGPVPSDNQAAAPQTEFSFATSKSLMFDGVMVLGGKESVDFLRTMGEVKYFVVEAFKHCKPIIAFGEGVELLNDVRLPGVSVSSGDVVSDKGVVSVKTFGQSSFELPGQAGSLGKAVFDAIAAHRHYSRDTASVIA